MPGLHSYLFGTSMSLKTFSFFFYFFIRNSCYKWSKAGWSCTREKNSYTTYCFFCVLCVLLIVSRKSMPFYVCVCQLMFSSLPSSSAHNFTRIHCGLAQNEKASWCNWNGIHWTFRYPLNLNINLHHAAFFFCVRQ